MLKVILADDEEIIREGICQCVDWEKLGYIVAGQAEDGEQALELVEAIQPDVIITDIKMPFVNGLEFVERIKEKNKDAFVIIVSGHDEFQYAQKALKLGVYEYILKPVDPEYLTDLLVAIREEYAKRLKEKNEVLVLKEKLQKSAPLVKEKYLKDIIHGNLEASVPDETVSAMNDFIGCCYSVIIAQLDDYYFKVQDLSDAARMQMEKQLYGILEGVAKTRTGVILLDSSIYEYIICLSGSSEEELRGKQLEICSDVRSEINSNISCTITMAMGGIHDNLNGLANSYREAADALLHKFLVGNNKDMFYEAKEMIPGKELKEFENIDAGLVSAIKTADKGKIKEILDTMVKQIYSHGSRSHIYMEMIIGSIYIQAMKVIKESGGAVEEVLSNHIDSYKRVLSHQTVEGMVKELLVLLNDIVDYIQTKKSGKFDVVIDRAKECIGNNFTDTSFSLEDVARHVNVSSCYFSVIFKQTMGETFIDYITRLRIEKAKELLRLSRYKTYEISFMVGYNNSTYFSTTFKKLTGFSPTEYRLIN
jgi:two-component system, response regulator YesN